ncbi:outer membrane protein V [Hoeflea sp. IMCC20628]|uniref:MipA/OmpV family protein n=1 Tax=Hoeflea sp. IMCC20628 TaxID=1620421 RepID=UPI00063BF49F|nr:MipA/OmpV family protein [Hoeflea sp. IMCC20628]AKH98966.1 outer membrane protein V [Hoeflea sp. IMCC20628]
MFMLPLMGAASAQDASAPGIGFELGLGGVVAPSYEGSSRYMLSPYPIISFNYLRLGNGFSLGGGDGQGLSFKPSFSYNGERNAVDEPALAGMNTVEAAVELGAGLKYTAGPISVFGALRYGVTGHNAVVGEIGADYAIKPNEALTLSLGPRLSFASSNYMNTYFGVTAAESVTSGFTAYTASGGIKSAGIAASARYDFNENWAGEAGASWNRLVGDAADSPLIAAGSRDQYTANIGLIRKFQFDF